MLCYSHNYKVVFSTFNLQMYEKKINYEHFN